MALYQVNFSAPTGGHIVRLVYADSEAEALKKANLDVNRPDGVRGVYGPAIPESTIEVDDSKDFLDWVWKNHLSEYEEALEELPIPRRDRMIAAKLVKLRQEYEVWNIQAHG